MLKVFSPIGCAHEAAEGAGAPPGSDTNDDSSAATASQTAASHAGREGDRRQDELDVSNT